MNPMDRHLSDEEITARLSQLMAGPRNGLGPTCPAASEWSTLAAGIAEPERREHLLNHASECDACGALLHGLVEDFTRDVDPEETDQFQMLRTSSPAWQRSFAQEMAASSRRTNVFSPWLAKAAAIFLVCSGGGWWGFLQWTATRPARLIAMAYTQQRPFDFRIPGADYGPVRVEKRGSGSSFQRPASLLDAEARIARELEKNPENAEWLGLRAQAEMLGWDSESAIATLTRALDQKPSDPDLMAGLGMAYALRAEQADRAIDYGMAIEYLSRSLKARPDHLETLFNRAVVYERMFLVDQAIEEWKKYLTLDPKDGWANDARRRLAELEAKKKARKEALDRISVDPEVLLRAIERGEPLEPESYYDIALTEWLPRRWDDTKYDRALQALARLSSERHGDRWWRDVLAARKSDNAIRGSRALAEAIRANQSNQAKKGIVEAEQSAAHLRAAGDAAGAVRAEAEYIYAARRTFQPIKCVDRAISNDRIATKAGYSWIRSWVRFELGLCRAIRGDVGAGYRDMEHALFTARSAGYKALVLVAEGILAGEQTNAGNLQTAWGNGRDGLARFWSGAYPGARAHQIYDNLRVVASNLMLTNTAYVFAKAGAQIIAGTRRRLTEAGARVLLAGLAAETGSLREAEEEYDRARNLFEQMGQVRDVQEHRLFAEINRADVELSGGRTATALERLSTVREQARSMDSVQVQMRVHRALGEAHWRTAQRDHAETHWRAVINLSERGLASLRGFEERANAIRSASQAYRGIVELQWKHNRDPAGPLESWQWFRSGEWPGPRTAPGFDVRDLRQETFVSYAELPGGLVVWVFDDRGIEGHRIDVDIEHLRNAVRRFARLCADRGSSVPALRREARQLFDWLLSPVAHRLDGARALIIEPDTPVAAVPWPALLDKQGRYLGDRFAIVIASSVADYHRRRATGSVHSVSRALVIADPLLDKEMTRSFPPLPQAQREGGRVANFFPRSTTLAGKAATSAAMEGALPQAEVVHFAGHGFSNAGNGGLLLAPDENGALGADVIDGKRLAAQDWTRCKLAVMSACSSGTGETSGPVNPESLVRRLLWAGASRVVASRWNVDAETGVELMDEFYSALLAGQDVPAALRHSSKRLRERTATAHPYFWAGFQTFGTR